MPRQAPNRREFLKACAAMGLAAAAFPICPGPALALTRQEQARIATATRALMGTFVSISVVHPSQDFCEEALERGFARMAELIRVFDRFDAASPLSVLNDQGVLHGAPPELTGLLGRAREQHEISQGAFDPSVKPLLDLFASRAATDPEVRVDDRELDEVLPLVDLSALRLSASTLELGKKGMGLTLDGLAKGHIVDAASAALLEMGAENHLVNAGGDIRASGGRSALRPWAIAVQNPGSEATPFTDVIRLRNGALATSGGYEVWFGENRLTHHIVDPRTGRSPLRLSSATVRAANVADADALSTALFVSPPGQGLKLIDTLPGVEGLLLTANGSRLASHGWNTKRT
ncbi:MAG: FAD:protein FMN transferase [Desulfovibrionaceae bacterium]